MDRRIGSFSPERFKKLQTDKKQRLLRSVPHQEEDFLELEFHRKRRNHWVADTMNLASSSSSPIQVSKVLHIQNPVSQPIQAPVNQAVMAQVPWIQNNASPISFQQYHDLPKDPPRFCSKFIVNDPNHTIDEHIKVFEDALCNRRILHEDVACRLVLYSLG